MPYSADHSEISQTLGAWRTGHNPDGRERTGGELEMPADLWRRLMSGAISPHEAQAEWKAREPQQRAFNDRLRAEAGLGGYTADASAALDPDGQPTVRDASTGQYADLNEAARAATGVDVPGGLTPTARPVKRSDGNDGIRAAYEAVVARRAS